jgi:hypothetical protein
MTAAYWAALRLPQIRLKLDAELLKLPESL